MDPFQGLATFVLGRLKDSTIALWWKFLFELAFSGIGSFLLICGLGLVAGGRPAVCIGSGMIAAVVSMVYLFRKESSRLTKGMIVVLPSIEADKELATDFETIQKAEK
jgi:hypothetical protein